MCIFFVGHPVLGYSVRVGIDIRYLDSRKNMKIQQIKKVNQMSI